MVDHDTFNHKIQLLKEQYIKNRVLFIDGRDVIELLIMLGSTEDDLNNLQNISEKLYADPTLNFRQSRNGRFCYRAREEKIYRTKFQPFVLSTEEDFIRHDSGKVRNFVGLNEDLVNNLAFQNLLKIKYTLISDMRFNQRNFLDYTSEDWITTLFHLRTITTPKILGEPALEGVHSDGVDHTMTTLLGHHNMSDDSAITHIHSMNEKSGIRVDDINQEFLLNKFQHKKFLDTVFIVDHERKHSLTPLFPKNSTEIATRDMLIFFTRKPCLPNHISYQYDSVDAHPDYPVSFSALKKGVINENK